MESDPFSSIAKVGCASSEEFRKRLVKLPSLEAAFLREKLRAYVYPQLRKMPHLGPNIRKLRAYKPETWRYRIGCFRVFYLVDESERIVFMLTFDQRRDAHR